MTSQQEETAYRFMLLKSKCCFAAAISYERHVMPKL